MTKIAVMALVCAAAACAQKAGQESVCKNLNVPAYKPGQYFYDPDRMLDIEKAAHMETVLERAPIDTRVLFCRDVPAKNPDDHSAAGHYGLDYPAGHIGEIFSKPVPLGEYKSPNEKPSLVLVVTPKHGDSRLRWWISSNTPYPDKIDKINEQGFRTFSLYLRGKNPHPLTQDNKPEAVYAATLKTLNEVVWPTLNAK